MFKVLNVEEAQDTVVENFKYYTKVEEVNLENALHRVLSYPVAAGEDMPPFSRSTMDGFAVKAEDTFGASEAFPMILTLAGEVPMGKMPPSVVQGGEAMQVSTGSVLPEGADAVVMLEYVENLENREIMVYRPAAPGENIIRRGDDYRPGVEILPAGHMLRSQDLGALAGMGITRVNVNRLPVTAVISTGDEIVDCRNTPLPGQIRDINTTAITTLVTSQGSIPLPLGIIPDRKEKLMEALQEAVSKADIIIISGGSSVGTRDVTVEAIEGSENGGIFFHGIAVRPGKPTILGKIKNKPVFGLSGNPVSAMIGFLLLVKPLIRLMQGLPCHEEFKRKIKAKLKNNLPSTTGREDYYRVHLLKEEGEEYTAEPVLGSPGLISTMVKAHGLLRVPRNVEGLYQGDEVEVELLD